MIRLSLASLRSRAATSLATFAAVLLGCSILIACAALFESAIRLDAPPQRLGGAAVVITGSAGFHLPDEESETVPYAERPRVDAGLAAKVAQVPGVGRAIPDVSFPAAVVAGERLLGHPLSGHGWESAALTPYVLSGGEEPRTSGQVVLDATLAESAGKRPGDKVDIVVGGQARSFTVAGVARASRQVDAPALFFSTPDVQRFSPDPGKADAIGVISAPGVSAAELARRLPAGLTILTGNDRGMAEFIGIAASRLPLILLSSIFGGLVIVVMALVVSATISLTVRVRLRELALLRASGATAGQVHRMVVGETMTVSVLAALAGLLPGWLLGRQLFSLSAQRGLVPPELRFHPSVIAFAAGVLVAVAVPWLAAGITALSAARVRPIQALAEAAIPPVTVGPTRRLLALVLGGVTVVLASTTMFMDPETASAVGGPAVLTGGVAVGLIGPELLNRIVAKVSVRGTGGMLAVINTRSRAVQFSSVLTPLTLATAIALSNVYAQTTHDDAAVRSQAGQFQTDAVITSQIGGVSAGLLADVRTTPGVAGASALVSSRGWIEKPYDSRGSDPGTLLGIDAAEFLTAPVVSGSLRDLSGDTAALPATQADDLGIKLGDRITLRLGDGAASEVKVVALLDSPAGYGAVVLPAALLAPHTTAGLPSAILVRAASNPDALAATLERATRARPGIDVGDQDGLSAMFSAQLGVQAWISYLLAALAIAYAALAAVNTLAVSVLARRREFAVQRLAGATRRQVRRMLLIEGALVATISIVLGVVIAAFTVLPMAVAVGSILPTGPVWVLLAVIAAVVLIVAPVTLASARLAMRRGPMDVISSPAG
ncbi:putative ABC transport system permease protein [Nonomuraea solani]|uniref:Putative ABC transport system permease protein n=1 Tax=Nonomuraea solani TaxID=1144553 RepID=A0A1H6EEF0_9ACTN|nr:FtsX-like permease family protein [Nonomuraea solani]SEG96170.1 putative ABC transport system permease protein [Nonomuraea solani]